jgi:hypothetical protein
MTTTVERLGIVETKVENLSEKIDHLKVDVREMHDCLDKTRDELKGELEKMYGASCNQHAALAKDIAELKGVKDRWTWMIAGGLAVLGWLSGHSEKIFSIFS